MKFLTFSNVLRILLILLSAGLAIWGEIHHFIGSFRLFTFCAFAVAAILATTLAWGRIRDFLLIVTTMLIGLSALEAIAMVLERRPVATMTEGWSVPRPIIGWGPAYPGVFHAKRQTAWGGKVIYDVNYTIDENLFRQTRSSSEGPATVFFGDSYTFGDGLNDPDTLPQQLATLTHEQSRIINLGFTGYGPQQFLRGVETGFYDKAIGDKPKVFFFLTAPWHAQRTACKASWTPRSPHYHLTPDGIAFGGECNEGLSRLWHEFLYNTAIYRFFLTPFTERLTQDDVELYIRILSEAIRQSKAKYGVDTIVLYLYDAESYLAGTGFTNQDIVTRFTAAGAKVIDVTLEKARADGLMINIPDDGHPTALANRLRAGLLIEQLGIQVTDKRQ